MLSTKKATKKKNKKESKHGLDQGNMLVTKKVRFKKKTIKKKEGRKWKTQIRNKHLASLFRCIQFGRMTDTIRSGCK